MATELAKAYVQIVPTANGITGSLTNLLGGECDSAGASGGESFASSLISKVKGLIAAAGIGALLKESISAGADYEQLTGGVETLFKDSSDTIMQYANDAYKNVGLSANEYMETCTGFAASMISSVGGDTEKAAEQANKAIQEMSDNANKMGSDMSSIQNAYSGFAKQNYTMLDNLKLGYGGTKEEMQRLLSDAEAISGVTYDISSYSDIVDAIGVIQDEMGITGTTAKEAASTFSGSFASMQAAATNLLTAISSGTDLTSALDNMFSTAYTFVVGNAIPMIGTIVSQVVTEGIPYLVEGATSLMTSLAQGLEGGLPGISDEAMQSISTFLTRLQADLPLLAQAGINLLKTLAKGVVKALPGLASTALQLVAKLVAYIGQNLPKILQVGISLLGKLMAGIIKAIPQIPGYVVKVFNKIKTTFGQYDWGAIGKNIMTGIKDGLSDAIASVVKAAKDAASKILSAIKDKLGIHSPSKYTAEYGKYLDLGLAGGITDNLNYVDRAVEGMKAATLGSLSADYQLTAANSDSKFDQMVELLSIIADKDFDIELNGRSLKRGLRDIGVVMA